MCPILNSDKYIKILPLCWLENVAGFRFDILQILFSLIPLVTGWSRPWSCWWSNFLEIHLEAGDWLVFLQAPQSLQSSCSGESSVAFFWNLWIAKGTLIYHFKIYGILLVLQSVPNWRGWGILDLKKSNWHLKKVQFELKIFKGQNYGAIDLSVKNVIHRMILLKVVYHNFYPILMPL